MDIAVGSAIAAAAKKVLVYLAGDKKGRKILLYTVCIALFIVSIPMITLLGLFGWASGNSGTILDADAILAELPDDQLAQIQTVDEVCNNIATLFEAMDLGPADQNKAKAIYSGHLVGMETEEDFYMCLLVCFLWTTEEMDVYDLIEETFQVVISEEDQATYDSLYGETPTRL